MTRAAATFDPVLLRTFVDVVESGGFTRAAERLRISQSTVSQHVQKLERLAGRPLLTRNTHCVEVTADGAVLVDLARDALASLRRAEDYFAAAPQARVRLGVSEDVALTRLPDLLRAFVHEDRARRLELQVGLTGMLYERLDAGQLDLVFAKRRKDDERGDPIWREELAWMSAPGLTLTPEEAVPLLLYPSSSITSRLATEALNRVSRPWFIAGVSSTLGGLRAAALSGLGVTAQSSLLLQDGRLVPVPAACGLPRTETVEFVLLARTARPAGPVAALADLIRRSGRAIWSADEEPGRSARPA